MRAPAGAAPRRVRRPTRAELLCLLCLLAGLLTACGVIAPGETPATLV